MSHFCHRILNDDILFKGSKREILANLANFAYDPINYDYFLQLNIPDIFIGK